MATRGPPGGVYGRATSVSAQVARARHLIARDLRSRRPENEQIAERVTLTPKPRGQAAVIFWMLNGCGNANAALMVAFTPTRSLEK